MSEKRFSLRIDETLLKKISYIADYNARSINGELQNLIKQHIISFEKENGKIIFNNCEK